MADSKCDIAKTDRIVGLNELSEVTKATLLSVIVWLLKEEGLPLVDVYLLAKEWNFDEKWNELASVCGSEEDFELSVRRYVQSIPYPSTRATALETMKLIMALVSRANELEGQERFSLSIKMEKNLHCFSVEEVEKKQFNLMMEQSIGLLKDRSYEEYKTLQEELSQEDILLKELITPYLEKIIDRIESGIDYKVEIAVKNTAQDVSRMASTIHEKVKDNLNEIRRFFGI
jgi:hypothetical protein